MVEFTAGASLEGATGKVLGVPVFAERNWGPGAEAAADAVGDRLEAQLDLVDFTGKLGQVAVVPSDGPFDSYAFIGLGEEADSETVRQAAGWFARAERMASIPVRTIPRTGTRRCGSKNGSRNSTLSELQAIYR